MPENGNGAVKISDEVISIIAGAAASEIEGVYSMGGAPGLADFLGTKKNITKGVKGEVKDGKIIVNIHITVSYGARIPAVAWEIQEKVKEELEKSTGMCVEGVNVHIDGINFPKNEPAPSEEN